MVNGVPVGATIGVAVRGEWWEGTLEYLVTAGVSEVAMVCQPVVRVAGRIAQGADRVGELAGAFVEWRGNGGIAPDWHRTAVVDGAFSVWVPADELALGERVVVREGEIVGRAAGDDRAPESVRIVLR